MDEQDGKAHRAGCASTLTPHRPPSTIRVSSSTTRATPSLTARATPPSTGRATPPSSAQTTPSSARVSPSTARLSPYPQRSRTPVRAAAGLAATNAGRNRARVSRLESSLDGSPSPAPSASTAPGDDNYELIVLPLVKTNLSQKDTTATRLEKFFATGKTFDEIRHKVWEKFHPLLEGRASKSPSGWECETEVFITEWSSFFHSKVGKHRVESERNERSWNPWLKSVSKETVKLVIYTYGDSLAKKDDHSEFTEACVRLRLRDRAGAAAEEEMQVIVAQLQARWETTFKAKNVTWRMWANHVVRNLNKSTWEAAVEERPPDAIVHLLRPADSPLEEGLNRIAHNGHLALDSVQGSCEDYELLQKGYVAVRDAVVVVSAAVDALGAQFALYERSLMTRQRCVQASLDDVRPPPLSDVINPLIRIQNVEDVDHAE